MLLCYLDVQKYRGLAKLYFEEAKVNFFWYNKLFSNINYECDNLDYFVKQIEKDEGIKMEYHMFEKNTYCNGAAFVGRDGGVEEDDGWIITFVHNEDTNKSQVGLVVCILANCNYY